MKTGRLEAFSDGVLAIVITIMVLELRVPEHAARVAELRPLVPVILSYVLSFIYVGIYWNNHHHLLHVTERASGGILWANLHLLFWLSLIPFVTRWMGETEFATEPTACYGVVLLMAAVAYSILLRVILHVQGKGSVLGRAVGKDWKGKGAIVLYAVAVPLSLVRAWLGGAVYVGVALMWLVPDRRIEGALHGAEKQG